MTIYVVIDTNVLVSAMLAKHQDSATVQLLNRLFNGDFIPLYSDDIMFEYNRVLYREKFQFLDVKVSYLISSIKRFGILVESEKLDVILPDITDVPFYEVVMEMKDKNGYLVTGNLKHFPKKDYIVTARQMIDILDGVLIS